MGAKELMLMITVKNVYKTYGKKGSAYEALRGINVAIKDGESLAIVGKSGSGKSTLMHLLAGLDHPTQGEVVWDKQSLGAMDEDQLATLRSNKVGFVFQQFFLQPTMTVLENATLPLKIAGVAPAQRKHQGLEALKAVGLLEKANNRATDLSGGQRQRVAIARALINNPSVIFADEPTGNLDSETSQQVTELLFRLQRERHITLIIVTHDSDLAQCCDRIMHIQDGKVVK
jgi:putative ABC transport system ATP-binding protein